MYFVNVWSEDVEDATAERRIYTHKESEEGKWWKSESERICIWPNLQQVLCKTDYSQDDTNIKIYIFCN